MGGTMQKSDRIKAEVSLRAIADAAGTVWDLKKSRPAKGDWWGSCPLHGEATASFHVVEPAGTGGVFKCFGCHKGGSVIDFTMEHLGLDFVEAMRRLADDAGISGEISEERQRDLERQRQKAKDKAEREAQRQAETGHRIALQIWRRASTRRRPYTGSAKDVVTSVLPRYLKARGVRLAAIGGIPGTLRIAPMLDHRENGGAVVHSGPAMVAAIGRGKLLGVHRTWITAKGRASHSDGRKIAKQWIGRTGALMGQPCVLTAPSPSVVVGEGIETTLAAYSSLVSAGQVQWSAEAALSRGAITGPSQYAGQLWTPRPGVEEVLILGEGSSKHPAEARQLYEGAAARLRAMGLRVRLTVPHGRWDLDLDFADVALMEILKGVVHGHD